MSNWENEPATAKQLWTVNNDLGAYFMDYCEWHPEYEFPWDEFKNINLTKRHASNIIDWLKEYLKEGGKKPDIALTIKDVERIAETGKLAR